MSDSTSRFWFLLIPVLWLGLLGADLLEALPAWSQAVLGRPLPPIAVLGVQGAFVLAMVLMRRAAPSKVRGTDFLTPLRDLFFGPGKLAFVCAGLLVIDRLASPELPLLGVVVVRNTLYTLNLGFLAYFLADTLYTWRDLLMFRPTPHMRLEWMLFEVLLTGTLLATLLVPVPPRPVWVPLVAMLALFGTYLNLGHQRWVTYLLRPQRVQALFLHMALLLALAVFALYFRLVEDEIGIVVRPSQQFFLWFAFGLASVYAVGSMLVMGFNFPAAAVFEQRRDELLDFQRQLQEIQTATTDLEVYERLLQAALRATEADVGWLTPPPGAVFAPMLRSADLPSTLPAQLLGALRTQGVDLARDFVDDELAERPAVEALAQPYQSLLRLIVPGPDEGSLTGELVLLKVASHGFDQGAQSLVQVFLNQTQLTLRNLRLMHEAVKAAQEAATAARQQEMLMRQAAEAAQQQERLTREAMQAEDYKRELIIAASVQSDLIPRKLPSDRVLDISVWAQAAKEVGGDFYDFLQLSDSRLAIIIGDVSGKGITAAFHVAQMKGIFHALMQLDHAPEPDRFMVKANAALAHCLELRSFITASLYVIDYEQRGFVFARAGHCHTLYYNSLLEKTFYFQTSGLGLGILRNASYAKRIANLYYDYNAGDVMIIYTDGITEARSPDGQEYGEERLRAMLASTFYYESAEVIRNAIVQDLQGFSADAPVHDDQTLLVIRFKEEISAL